MHAPKILLIADDDHTHQGLRRSLRQHGCEVFEAQTQAQAVEMAREVEPDLVVQEDAFPCPGRPDAFGEVMSAIEILAGPLPVRSLPAMIHAGRAASREKQNPQAAAGRRLGISYMGRVGLEPTTNRLKAECSTS